MANQKRKYNRKNRKRTISRSRKIVLAIGITTVVLVVATYAWFIGITTVTVNPFEVNIVSTEGLAMSLDGLHWETEVKVTKGIIEGTSKMYINGTESQDKYLIVKNFGEGEYAGEYPASNGNKNHWAGAGTDENHKGLEPVSTSGELVTTAGASNSEVKFFTKTTLTSEAGGYKLLAGEVNPSTANAYVAFDLFIKNSSGSNYTATYNKDNDEALFLTGNSQVLYDTSGSNVGQGIENSVRVGFFALGRVNANNATGPDNPDENKKALIQGISCQTTEGVTNLCNLTSGEPATAIPRGYNWNIWEPNDTAHNAKSVTRFNSSCIKRSVDGTSYETGANNNCTPIQGDGGTQEGLSNGKYIKTFAINSSITSSDTASNIYDGLNGYTNAKMTDMSTRVLTDTENDNEETRSALLYIAPASITKIRVYIWLEGQDVDNFDLATIYQTLKVNFGFTKDRYETTPEESGETSPSPTENPGVGE